MGLIAETYQKAHENAAKCRNVHISQKEGESGRGPDGFAQDWRQRRRKPLRSENKQMHIRSDRKEKRGKVVQIRCPKKSP